MRRNEIDGVGVGWRRELAHDLMSRPACASFVEVVAETCMVRDRVRAEVRAVAEVWPVIPHGVKLSLGSADGIDIEHARRLGRLARELGSPWITEHVSFTRAGSHEIGHLTQLPRTRDAVRVVARNVDALRRAVGEVPIALENVAWSVRWPDEEMTEAEFYREVVEATGCPLLLDLGNLRANALNEGRDPSETLDAFPLDRVAMIHVAGGAWERSGGRALYVDSHAHPVDDEVFALLARVVARRGAVPVILERDSRFPPFDELAAELDRLREVLAGRERAHAAAPSAATPPAPPTTDSLAIGQRALAELLTSPDAPSDLGGFDRDEVDFARNVLRRKRIDDALPLLPRLAAREVSRLDATWGAIDAHPRSPRNVALNDAWHIARAALDEPALRRDATLDALVLAARSVSRGGVRVPRVAPWVGRRALGDGRAAWAYKGLGASSPVRLLMR